MTLGCVYFECQSSYSDDKIVLLKRAQVLSDNISFCFITYFILCKTPLYIIKMREMKEGLKNWMRFPFSSFGSVDKKQSDKSPFKNNLSKSSHSLEIN